MSGAEPWFASGLRFECHRCGRCCRGAGNVWVSADEIAALAAAIGVAEDAFVRSYTRRRPRGRVLRSKPNQDCVFLGEAGCTVYAQRPKQCRTYPFWAANLHAEQSWAGEAGCCPGIGEGRLHSRAEIEALAADDGLPAHRTRRRIRG